MLGPRALWDSILSGEADELPGGGDDLDLDNVDWSNPQDCWSIWVISLPSQAPTQRRRRFAGRAVSGLLSSCLMIRTPSTL